MSVLLMSQFEQEKLKYFFKFFEPNEQNQLDKQSLEKFMKRVLEFTGWDPESADARGCYEVHEAFFEILFDKTSGEDRSYEDAQRSTPNVTLEDWMSVWANLLPGCKGMMNFPIWLRLLPKTLFRVIDRDMDGLINEAELFEFYKHMIKLDEKEARSNAKLAYAQMTDNGSYPLNLEGYEQIFSNFLLGRTPYGPGRHIFGCFEHSVDKTPFSLIKPATEEDFDMSIKVYQEKRPKKKSLTGL